MSALFSLREAGMRYNGNVVLRGATLDFGPSELVSVVGPNGAGKSTLLGIMAGLRRGHSGTCLYRGKDVAAWPRGRFAREVSFVPQHLSLQFPFTAEQVVMMGRTPYCDGLFEGPGDRDAVERAMSLTDMTGFRHRDFRSLSGGEQQRVVLASALAQEPLVLLLDEPTAFLDLRHQLSMYRLMRDLCEQGLLVVAVTHDLNMAAAFATRVVALAAGEIAADAAPAEVITQEKIRKVFGVESEVREGRSGRPWIVYGE